MPQYIFSEIDLKKNSESFQWRDSQGQSLAKQSLLYWCGSLPADLAIPVYQLDQHTTDAIGRPYNNAAIKVVNKATKS